MEEQPAHPESFDQLMAQVDAIISEWNDWYKMPTDIDLICSAFDAIDEAMTMIPGSIARRMFNELWSGRVFS